MPPPTKKKLKILIQLFKNLKKKTKKFIKRINFLENNQK